MITLGIETSGRAGSVALLSTGDVLGRRDLSQTGRRHAQSLLSELQSLLQQTGLSPRRVETIAVSIGPGSFTGLRVGVACAKTWAYATGCHLVAVDTFLAVAHRASTTHSEVNVISDAQRGELFVGRYHRGAEGAWRRAGEVAIIDTDKWIDSLTANVAVTGPALSQLQQRIAGRARMELVELSHPRAEEIAQIGWELCEKGITDDLWKVEPLYLRRSAAEEKAEASPQQGR
jgi:tRNA threonylcarbamoyladenosine biosynthesis protein TsaB